MLAAFNSLERTADFVQRPGGDMGQFMGTDPAQLAGGHDLREVQKKAIVRPITNSGPVRRYADKWYYQNVMTLAVVVKWDNSNTLVVPVYFSEDLLFRMTETMSRIVAWSSSVSSLDAVRRMYEDDREESGLLE